MIDLLAQCAPDVSPVLMHALVRTESSWKPYAIGPDSGNASIAQPKTLQEAVQTAQALKAAGHKFSVGLAQIHMSNVEAHGLTWEQAFDPCKNLALGHKILSDFFKRAQREGYEGVDAVWAALRGYNSGGVHRPISDKYAYKIFSYMKVNPQPTTLPTAIPRTTPASSDPRFINFAPVTGMKPVNLAVPASKTIPDQALIAPETARDPNELREGESPDIFQTEGQKQGF